MESAMPANASAESTWARFRSSKRSLISCMAGSGFIVGFFGLGIAAGSDVGDFDEALQVGEPPVAELALESGGAFVGFKAKLVLVRRLLCVETAIRHRMAEVTVVGGDAVEIQVAQECLGGGISAG